MRSETPSTNSLMRSPYTGRSSIMAVASVYTPKPTKYRNTNEMLHTTKLAKPLGKRSFMKNSTIGSSRNAIIVAMTTVMKNTRP